MLAKLLAGTALAAIGLPSSAQMTGEPRDALSLIVIQATIDRSALSNDLLLSGDAMAAKRISSSDTASLLPGVDAAGNGRVSSLPMIHGLGDDRLRTLVDGVPVGAACPMHMNPPLSYIDPTNVTRIDVLPGVTPVSLGGDSIGGTILVESAPPVFAAAGEALHSEGSLSSFYRSNSAAFGGAASFTLASGDFSIRYDGSGSRAADYRDGEGERIQASRYETSNQQVTAAYRSGQNLFELGAAVQYMPYEGFPNADMDLTDNVGQFVHLRYQGAYAWGNLSITAYYDHIHHEMDGDSADRYPPMPVSMTAMGMMPTVQRGQDYGYRLKAGIAVTPDDTVRIGNELHGQTLDDRWPGEPAGMMFDYVDINKATRMQLGSFAEWERQWSPNWTTLLGVRNDTVWMNTGAVQGYDGLDSDAEAFNAADRSRTDVNFDATFLTGYKPDDRQSYSLGLARKTRSPNFYERYAWGTSTMGMISWFGDGNGYTGNPDLKPETAYTASLSADWHDATQRVWQIKATPYYTAIEDYIGVEAICGPACSGMPASQLMFANHRARLYGVDLAGSYSLWNSLESGAFRLSGTGGFVHGQDLASHTGLYHMMPLHATLALEHQRGNWSSAVEFQAVGSKTEVDETRSEPATGAYGLLDVRTAYVWRVLRLDFAVTNLLNRQYANPLGGSWQSALYTSDYMDATFRPLPAMGRSFNTGVTVKF